MTNPNLHTILGATGNIGKALAQELAKYTTNIRLVSRNPSKINPTDQLLSADLLDADAVDNAVEGSSVVYLVAGLTYNIEIWQQQWPVVMRNTLDACIKHGARLVFFDNMYCYDPTHVGHLTEESPVNPQSKKGKVRAKIASMMMDNIQKGTLQGMIVRAADFYGPNAKSSFLNETVINRMKAGKTAQWLYAKNKRHSFTYIPDAAKATAFLAHKEDAWNQVWHLPTDDRYPSGEDIVQLLSGYLDGKNRLQTLPGGIINFLSLFVPLLREIKDLSYQLEEDYRFDSSKIEKAYGIKPTPLEEGLRACL